VTIKFVGGGLREKVNGYITTKPHGLIFAYIPF
jgi:hypothetical protein